MIMEKLISLKEEEREVLLTVDIVNEGQKGKLFSIQAIMNIEYQMILAPFVERIMNTIQSSLKVVDLTKIMIKPGETVPYSIIDLFLDEDGVNIVSRFCQIDEKDLFSKGESFYKELNDTLIEMVKYTNNLLNDYAELKDSEKIYSPKEFSFMYMNRDGKWIYDGFQRLDRDIPEQKREVHELCLRGIHDKLLQMVNAKSYLDKNDLLIKFVSDGFSVDDIQVATHNFGFR
jgi:hypothetical protein